MTNEIMKNQMTEINSETLFEKFFTTTGRIGRMTFFKRTFMIGLIEFFALFCIGIVSSIHEVAGTETPMWVNALNAVVIFAALIPGYFLNTKRLHDIGKDSTLAKIFLGVGILSAIHTVAIAPVLMSIPLMIENVVLIGFTFYLLLTKGDENANEYGDTN